jgi:hypothetical protein
MYPRNPEESQAASEYFGTMAKSLQQVSDHQRRFRSEVGLSRNQIDLLSETERGNLQARFQEWLKANPYPDDITAQQEDCPESSQPSP